MLSVVDSFQPENYSESQWSSIIEVLSTLTSLYECKSSSTPLKFVTQGGRIVLDKMLIKLANTCKVSTGAPVKDFLHVVFKCAAACGGCYRMLSANLIVLSNAWCSYEIPDGCFAYRYDQLLTVMQSWYYILRFYMRWGKESKKKFMHTETLYALAIGSTRLYCPLEDRNDKIGIPQFEESLCAFCCRTFSSSVVPWGNCPVSSRRMRKTRTPLLSNMFCRWRESGIVILTRMCCRLHAGFGL